MELDYSWNPLHRSLLRSSLLAEGPVVVATWMILLASANRFGETDSTPRQVASLLRITDDEAERAFEVLLSPDKYSHNKDHDGRRLLEVEGGYQLVSHAKYRRLASKAGATERKRRQRDRERAQKEADAVCEAEGCSRPAEAVQDGARVCTAHCFEREPGQEG